MYNTVLYYIMYNTIRIIQDPSPIYPRPLRVSTNLVRTIGRGCPGTKCLVARRRVRHAGRTLCIHKGLHAPLRPQLP